MAVNLQVECLENPRQEVAVAVEAVEAVVFLGKPLLLLLLDLDCNLLGKYLGKHLELYTKFHYRKFHKSLRS